MYANVALVEKEKHKNMKYEAITSMQFASEVSSILLASGEFFNACKSQPILFSKSGDAVLPCVLLGLRQNQSLFVDGDSKWRKYEYCPFFFRRYPFIYVQTGNNLRLGFDTDCRNISEEKGDALFNEEGELTEFTKNILKLMDKYQVDLSVSASFAKKIGDLGLLEPFDKKIRVGNDSFNIEGFMKVSEDKLKSLSSETVMELFKNGFMNLITAHLISLSNIEKLVLIQSQKSL